MATELKSRAQEGSTFVIVVNFIEKDSDGVSTPVIPNDGLTWTLMDAEGNIINSRSSVPLEPAESVDIVLSGADLALDGSYPEHRYVTIEGTYDSLFGSNLSLKNAVSFQIENLLGVP